MNVVFLSPHFPTHFYNFCQRLKERGVNVLGIGDASWEAIGDNCRNALTAYKAVKSLEDYDAVYKAFADYIYNYGRIDYVESENEYWLTLEARLRTDFNIPNGPHVDQLDVMNHKSLMKKAYKRAGIPTAKWIIPKTLEKALEFAHKVDYPIVVKPDKGVGAATTYKLKSDAELENFWSTKDPEVTFIEEECVPGHVETFDGITDSKLNVLFAASQRLFVSPMDAVNLDSDVVSFCQAPPQDLEEAGKKLLKEYDIRNRFFHFEFFRLDEDKKGLGHKGDIIGLEVNMRCPGGRIPDKMNYAYDTDVYTIWADSLIHDKCFMNSEFKHYIIHVGRKNSRTYAFSQEQVRERWGRCIMEEMDVPLALASGMGNHAYLLRADSAEERDEVVEFILRKAEGK